MSNRRFALTPFPKPALRADALDARNARALRRGQSVRRTPEHSQRLALPGLAAQALQRQPDTGIDSDNAGEASVEEYNVVPPYAETQSYVTLVQSLTERYRNHRQRPGDLPRDSLPVSLLKKVIDFLKSPLFMY
jgi:hypothetical protein